MRKRVPLPLALIAALVFLAWAFYPAARLQYQEQRERTRLEQELAEVRRRNSDLREQVDRLKTPEGVEEMARRNLGFVAPGERAYVVTERDEPTVSVVPPPPPPAEETSSSLWGRVLDYVFGAR